MTTTKRRALGKGLGSLIPDLPPSAPAEGLRYLDPGSMVPNRHQPRETFDEEDLKSLAESIRRDGILQPILVRPSDGGFEIVAGERRWRAAQRAGLKRIPAIVQSIAEDRALELALIENLQRRDLDPIEEARAYHALGERFGLTQEQIAAQVGKSRPAVANSLRMLRLPSDIQELIRGGSLSPGHARALLALDGEEEVRSLAAKFVSEEMTVRSAEEAARPAKTRERRETWIDPNVKAAQERLQSRMGTQVRIQTGATGKGRIEISFGSQDELSRLFDGLMTARF